MTVVAPEAAATGAWTTVGVSGDGRARVPQQVVRPRDSDGLGGRVVPPITSTSSTDVARGSGAWGHVRGVSVPAHPCHRACCQGSVLTDWPFESVTPRTTSRWVALVRAT